MDAVSHCAPGSRFQYQVPPKSPPFSMMRTSCTPASTIRAQVARPAKPPPMNANVTWSVLASRCATGVYGSWAKRPFSGRYCALPSARSRLSRSAPYLASKAPLSICGWGAAPAEEVVAIQLASHDSEPDETTIRLVLGFYTLAYARQDADSPQWDSEPSTLGEPWRCQIVVETPSHKFTSTCRTVLTGGNVIP